MNTKEIVKALHANQIIKTVVPIWAHCSIPYPFYRNGIACLGFYFYPMKKSDAQHLIQAPITQVITAYPSGHIVGITASPFFLNDTKDANVTIGEYPNSNMKSLSVAEGNALYDQYYAACDAFFESSQTESWKNAFNRVKEEGMDKYFFLFTPRTEIKTMYETTDNAKVSTPVSAPRQGNSISAKVRHSLRDIQNFLKKPVFAKENAEISRLINNCSREDYTIAVIGEFSRGKTTFLNYLLGMDCLPVGDLPTTAVLTKITQGEVPSATFVDRFRKQSKFELTASALENFLADDQGNAPEGVLNLTTPLNWLDKKNIVFYDTPGAGDIIGKRADIARKAISHCDCTIMAMSAQAACSMTEMEFLRANVILKAIPRCSILITKLDTIPENERMKVIDFVKSKISKVLPSAQYWIAQEMEGVDASALDAYGIEAIRTAIKAQSISDEEAARLREQQLIARVQMVLIEAKNEIQTIEEAEKLSDEEKCAAIKKLEFHKDHLDLIKQELEMKCESMQYAVEQEIIADLTEAQKNILADCQMSLQKTTMTKEWVERDFPYMLEKALKPVVGRIEKKIISSVSVARTNLAESVKKQLSDSGIAISLPAYETMTIDSDLAFAPENIERTRLISRCASIISVPVAMLVLGPLAGIGVLIGGGMGLGSELFLKKKIDEQKKLIAEQVNLHIEKMFNDIKEHLQAYVSKCYAELLEGVDKESQKAVAKAIEKINDANREKSNAPKESIALHEKLDQLIKEIENF